MFKGPKISVVIPVYNVADYLSRCLESLRCQSLLDIEIICVNDGSTDNSAEIIEKQMKADERILLINKKMLELQRQEILELMLQQGI